MVYRAPRRRGILYGIGVGNLSVTWNLLIVNVIAFIVFSVLLFRNPALIDSIALKPSNIFAGQYWWTFVTSMFMHGGLFHLFANMFSLIFVGSLVEKILGRQRYFWFYMVSGLFAGALFIVLSLIFTQDFNVFAVGASGALFGLIGFLMIITPNLPVYVMLIPIPIKMKYAAPGILVALWLISVAGNVPIGNTAHLGGLVYGVIYGLYIRNKYKRKSLVISRHFS
jgi:membrane associated rhomboid family serine protease